jgi:hypothetical protein
MAYIGAARDEQTSQSVAAEGWVDDGFDFPPTSHPGRELLTASLFLLLAVSLLVWGGWKLVSIL